MSDRKPDFYVVKREGLDGVPEWFTFDADGHVWDYQSTMRHRFVTRVEAASVAKKYGGRVIPVFCTSKRAEPKMRERSSAWVLKRLADGKALICRTDSGVNYPYRFNLHTGHSQTYLLGKWVNCAMPSVVDGKAVCRIAYPSEAPQ